MKTGQVIVLSTDGLWETRNQKGEMFGKQRLLETIRKNSHTGSKKIIGAAFEALNQFKGKTETEDDITMVVVKVGEPLA